MTTEPLGKPRSLKGECEGRTWEKGRWKRGKQAGQLPQESPSEMAKSSDQEDGWRTRSDRNSAGFCISAVVGG